MPVRSIENQAELMRHRICESLAGQRMRRSALRGHLAEIGLVAPQGAQHAYDLKRMAADGFNENGEIDVPDCVRSRLRPLVSQIDALDEAIGAIDKEHRVGQGRRDGKRLMTIPWGVCPVTASAIMATIQDIGDFASGREFSAFLGRRHARGLPAQAAARAHHQDGRPLPAQASGPQAPATLRHRKGHKAMLYRSMGERDARSARQSKTSSI